MRQVALRFAMRVSGLAFGLALAARPVGLAGLPRSRAGPGDDSAKTLEGQPAQCAGEIDRVTGLVIIHSPWAPAEPMVLDATQLGGMADEVLSGPGYAVSDLALQIKSIAGDEADEWERTPSRGPDRATGARTAYPRDRSRRAAGTAFRRG
jgi:hypothetical protein